MTSISKFDYSSILNQNLPFVNTSTGNNFSTSIFQPQTNNNVEYIAIQVGSLILAGLLGNLNSLISNLFNSNITASTSNSNTEIIVEEPENLNIEEGQNTKAAENIKDNSSNDRANDNEKTVKDILNKNEITVSENTLQRIINKYPTMVAIPLSNLTVEERVINLAKGLEGQKEFELISTTSLDDEMKEFKNELFTSGINENTIPTLLKSGEITEEEAEFYLQVLSYREGETVEPIILQEVQDAKSENNLDKFKSAYLQYGREQCEVYDSNNDGKIDFNEFKTVESDNAEELYNELATKAVFDTLDINNDNFIDSQEMASLVWSASVINDTDDNKTQGDITVDEAGTVTDGLNAIALEALFNNLSETGQLEEALRLEDELFAGAPKKALLNNLLQEGYNNLKGS